MSNQLVSAGIGVVGLLFGSMIGYIAYKALNPPETIVAEPEIIKEEISMEELEELCAELTDVEKENVLEVQGKVRSLQEQLLEKEAELERLKKEAKNEVPQHPSLQSNLTPAEPHQLHPQLQYSAGLRASSTSYRQPRNLSATQMLTARSGR